jgi:hypothetical protein
MRYGRTTLFATVILLSLANALAYGQGSATSSSISGTVVDTGGGVIPGATVTIKNTATNRSFTAVSNSEGVFVVPALEPGTYSVTVTLSGFKTQVYNGVGLTPGVPVTIKATLEVGSLNETVEVRGGAGIVNTQTATVSATLNVDQVNRLPMTTRNALNAVTFLPGVNTATTNRGSSFNGLPSSFSVITLDGVPNNDNYNKSSEGLFAMVTPRQDAVEAITVTTAAGGADVGGGGAVQISFVTRSGTNRFTGSGYHSYRAPELNTNYWFNKNQRLPKNDIVLNQYGFRQGGPIVMPGVFDGRGKAFFFFNYEELRLPNNFTRTRTVFNPAALSGNFLYSVSGATRSVNVLQLAAQAEYGAAIDPTVAKILGLIQASTTTAGTTLVQNTDPLTMGFTWQSPGFQIEKQPIGRVDYNFSSQHRLSTTYNWQTVDRDPDHLNSGDVRFPNSPNYSHYLSYRNLLSTSLRSTVSANVVNELRGGFRWGPGSFGDMGSNGPASFADTNGYALGLSLVTNWHTQNGPSARDAGSFNIDDTLTWQKGKHSVNFGTSIFINRFWVDGQQIVPSIGFGVDDTNDPAQGLFTTTSFPGASSAQLGNAETLFAVLTGRVSSVSGTAYLNEATNQYEYLGKRRQTGSLNEYSVFAQDSWRVSPSLTLNGGLRWDVQTAFSPNNSIMARSFYADACGVSGLDANGVCQFYVPGASGGVAPSYVEFPKGSSGYNTDWDNLAPNVGVAWRPTVETGFLRKLLGDPEQSVLRAGYSVAYNREGQGVFVGRFGSNPGSSTSVSRSAALGNIVNDGLGYPLYLAQGARLGPASYPASPSYPIMATGRSNSINLFEENIQVASARTYTVGFQRALSRDMAMEIRYVGTKGKNLWGGENYNEINIESNGFLDEFKLAMANLQVNNTSGDATRVGSFKYFGPGTGTSPLPIYLAYFNGRSDVTNSAAYSGTNWTNSTFVGRLAVNNPNPQSAASDLDGNAGRRASALAAGRPANLFVVNPDVSSANVWSGDGESDFNALQLELRRRLSRGFQVSGSYQYGREASTSFVSQRYGYVNDPSANVRHAVKFQWDWSLPIGRGRRFGNNLNAVLDGMVGGWEFNGAGRVQARTLDFGNVRLVGMTAEDLQKEYFFRITDDPINAGRQIVKILPDDIILNTRRAFNVSATSATGYSDLGVPQDRYIAPANGSSCIQLKAGDCAPRSLLIRAPWFTRVDISLAKKFQAQRRLNFELKLDVINVLNNIGFSPAANPGSGETIFQVTSAYQDINNTFDPGGRLGQIAWRINW